MSNNASFQSKKVVSRQSTVSSLSGEYNDTESEQNSSQSKHMLKRILSGEIPPAVQPRSEWSRRVQCIIECARQRNPYKPGLFVCLFVCYFDSFLAYLFSMNIAFFFILHDRVKNCLGW